MTPLSKAPTEKQTLCDLFRALYSGLTDPLFPLSATDAKAQLTDIHQRIDDLSRETLQCDPTLDLKDQLFETLMNRFDLLYDCRPILKKLYELGPCMPFVATSQLSHLYTYFSQRVQVLPIGKKGLMSAALVGVYVKTLSVWFRDETPDLSYTMAAVDHDLRRVYDLLDREGGPG